jgi:hypothetical protein
VKILPPLVAVLALAACATPPTGTAAPSSASAAPSAPASGTALAFPDVTKGSIASTTVDVIDYDPNAESVVVEPILFGVVPDICVKLGIPVDGDRCKNQEWLKEPSNVRYTLPLAPKAVFLSTTDPAEEEQDCIDTDKAEGKCELKGSVITDKLDGGPMMARLTTKDGAATRLAELYTP